MKTVFNHDHIIVDETSTTKAQALAFIAKQAHLLGYVADADAYYQGFLGREETSSTGLTAGMAIPHCKNETVQHAGVFVIRFSHGIEWQTMDDSLVNTAVALSIPVNGDENNVRMLTKLSRSMMRKAFREALQKGNEDEVNTAISAAIA